MDFDEYDYLEKTVEEEIDEKDSSKKGRESIDRTERSYRKRDEIEDGAELKRSKRSSGDDDEHVSRKDRDRDDDRDKERRRSGRDRDRDRDGERSSRDRGRDREKDVDREKDRRDKDRERERREREKEKEKERERSRRSKSRSEREREIEREERERSRRSVSRSERDREKEREERDRSRRSRSRSERDSIRERDFDMRDSRRLREKKEAVEPEADPERDQRTVFAYQMPLKATERDVYEFFSKAGKVRDVRLIMDRNSRRSKGVGNAIMMRDDGNTLHTCLFNSCCVLKFISLELIMRYIEFYDAMSVPMAIALSGQLLLGQPVMVKPSEAEKNLVQSNTTTGAAGVVGPYGAVDRKLYVGNLHFNMTESQLREIFEPFGTVEVVQLPLDLETGHCKGFGFIQFAHLEHAKAAQSLNGKLEIAGRTIKVSSVADHVGGQDTTAKSADFDDDEGGLALNAQSRALLMQKLDRSGIAASIGLPINGSVPAQQAISLPIGNPGLMPALALPTQFMPTQMAEPVGTPSNCLLLKNMFDPSTETEPDFDLDIKEDVEEECSKYGRVKHIYVDKNSAGFVYLMFETVEAASAAQRAMHMRWFARKMISAIYMQPQVYEAKFKGVV
ncbi:unnamed protein product [Vicia faba]|uniref:RRM domain-containing protein n=1 Tax=Vicia faba TaxID=3906 RepID=A0AAV0ZSB1_VICFA|nr:unnamed protein product [Vicia faba]